MNKAYYFLAFGILVILSIGIYFHLQKNDVNIKDDVNTNTLESSYAIIEWNGNPLIDRTIHQGDNCYGEFGGMRVEVLPCNQRKWTNDEIRQEVNFTWQGTSQINITWIFVYEGQLEKGGIDLWENGYYNTTETGIHSQWVSNYLITDIINYTNLGTPDTRCQFGNSNNTQMYEVNRVNITHGFNKQTWCFTDVTPINASAFYLSGNIDAEYEYKLQHNGFHWEDVTSSIVYLGYGLLNDTRSYYQVNEVGFTPQQSYYTQWRFTPHDNEDSGKWHIIGYEKEYGLVDSLNDDRYLYLDPTWDAGDMGLKLLAYYNFNDTGYPTNNWSVDVVTGWMNITSNATQTAGIISNARDFSTPNDGFFIPSSGKNMFQANWTVNVWFKKDNNNFGEIISGGNQWLIGTRNANYLASFNTLATNNCSVIINWCYTNISYSQNQWTMFTVIYNADQDTVHLWLNGTRAGIWGAQLDTSQTVYISKGDVVGNFPGAIDEMAIWNRTITDAEVAALWNNGLGYSYGLTAASTSFDVALNSPKQNTITNNANVLFSVNTTISARNSTNETFYIWGTTNATFGNDTKEDENFTTWYGYTLPTEGNYSWNARVCSTNITGEDINCTFAPANWTFIYDATAPTISVNYPPNGTSIFSPTTTYNVSLNATSADTYLQACWFQNITGNTTYKCNTNASQIFNFGWNAIRFWSNDTAGNKYFNDTTFYLYGLQGDTFNETTVETSSETYKLNMTYNSSDFTNAVASLILNGTSYTTTRSGIGNDVSFTRTIDVPLLINDTWYGANNYSILWQVGLTNKSGYTFYYNSSRKNQSIDTIQFAPCGSDIKSPFGVGLKQANITYMNFTFQDEASGFMLNGSITAFTGDYFYGSGSLKKSLSYSNATEATSYAFCNYPGLIPMNFSQGTIRYTSTGYGARTFASFNSLYQNTSTSHVLQLLANSGGSYVTFQVINSGQNVIEGAKVTIKVGATTIESRYTDAAGSATFFLDPLVTYTITTVKSGYVTNTVNIAPTQSQYTITLTSLVTETMPDFMKGVNYFTLPKGDELNNGTYYNFTFNITSMYRDLDFYGIIISNGTETFGAQEGTNIRNGQIRIQLNTANNSTMRMDYYWSINNTVFNSTHRDWTVTDTEGQEFSLKYLFTDLKNYVDSGMFGLNTTSLGILIFLVIFIFAGVLTYKFGFTSPAAIMMVIFGLVAIFDYIGLIPSPTPSIEWGIPTAMTFIVMLGVLIWEWSR